MAKTNQYKKLKLTHDALVPKYLKLVREAGDNNSDEMENNDQDYDQNAVSKSPEEWDEIQNLQHVHQLSGKNGKKQE